MATRGEVCRYYEHGNDVNTQGTLGFSIDDFLMNFNPPFPNHIKIDVDGLELAILSGARRTLADSRIRSMMVELNVSSEADYRTAIGLIEASGFRLISRGERQGTETEVAMNHLFQRS